MNSVIEIVCFTVRPGTTEADLVTATQCSQTFIATLEGFEYRSLSYLLWTDVIYWDCLASAKNACEQFKAHPDCQAFMALIDPKTVNIEHQEIKMSALAQS
ncbi:hypothetical protein [Shewanella surugensis]|uniref:Uncharacterized protein n=1 Tax=Shewanella surugensis TaxID=212020 RepID=A0ABT0LJU6_9GAMM|nr:hypothetical protein [Shewanella surugensis]MCL1127940.1 hypothetical protein [Shewanella surugensis]